MTVVTLNPTTDGDDLGTEISGGGYFSIAIGLGIGHGIGVFYTAIRLLSTGIPQGATINSASLQLADMQHGGGSPPYGTFYGEAVDSPSAFGAGSLPSTRIAANSTSASVTVTGANLTDIDVTAIVQELVNRAGFSGSLALIATPLGSGDYAASTSVTLTDYDLVVDYAAGGGTTYNGSALGIRATSRVGSAGGTFTPSTTYNGSALGIRATSRVGSAGGTFTPSTTSPAFSVQHLTPKDVSTSGGTDTITAVDTSSAIALNNNSRLIGGGPNGSAASINVDDASLGVRLTATTTVTYDREAAAAITNRASVSVWEYIGGASGPNEFIVRDRRTITLSSSDSAAFTPASVSDPTKLIPFITGIRHNDTGTNHGRLTAAALTNQSTGEVTVYGRGGTGTATIEVTTVEFTGSNWGVHYGTVTSATDTGTVTLGSSTSDWNDTLIIHQFFKGSAAANHAIADVTPTYVPGIGADEVDWEFNDNHDGNSDQVHVIYALENASMEVTRFTSSDSSAGNVNIDITSAGLADIDEALIWVSARSSGTGTAHLRGTRNAQLTSTTQAQHYAHRSGNIMSIELQIVKLPQDTSGGTAYSGSAPGIRATSRTGSAAGTFEGTATGTSSGIRATSRTGSAAGTFEGTATGTSSGIRATSRTGSAAGTFEGASTGTASGIRATSRTGSAAGVFVPVVAYSGSAPGVRATSRTGSAAGAFDGTATGTSSGIRAIGRTGSAASTFEGTATGSAPGIRATSRTGSAAGTFEGTATGTSSGIRAASRTGSAAGVFVPAATYSGSAPGIRATSRTGSAAGTFEGTATGTSSGIRATSRTGSAAGAFEGTATGTSSGIRATSRTGSAAGTFEGASTGTAPGVRATSRTGSAAGTFEGTATGSAPGIRATSRTGSAAGTFVQSPIFVGSAPGIRAAGRTGSAAGTFEGTVTGTSSGIRATSRTGAGSGYLFDPDNATSIALTAVWQQPRTTAAWGTMTFDAVWQAPAATGDWQTLPCAVLWQDIRARGVWV